MRKLVLGLLLVPCSVSGADKSVLRPPLRVDRDDHSIPEPGRRDVSELFAIVYNSWLRHLSPEYKALLARDQASLNVNDWDEVPDSTWFNNRMGLRPFSFQEILRSLDGQSPKPGPWKIIRLNTEGYTPKFDIQDVAGARYVLKFDLPSALERNSAAERICTLIMHGAGFNVPHNSIVRFRAEDLQLDEKSQHRDPLGKRRPMTPADLDDALKRLKALPDGRYRGLASFFLPGKLLGPFVYTGTRRDDPNDVIPHELRRELRGFRVIASWINHVDVKDINAMDCYIDGAEGRKYVKHYFLDFGSAMGSGDFVNGPYRVGHEYIYDGEAITRSLLSLGIWRRPWDVRGEIRYPEVGYYQAELFDAKRWKPNYPNLAFEQMHDADAYWGAKIVTSFSDETIRKLVESGEYSRPDVTRYVEDALKQRRDAIGNYWLDRITPVEAVILERDEANDRLRLRDLALERGYADCSSRAYRFWTEDLKGKNLSVHGNVRSCSGELVLSKLPLPVAAENSGAADRFGRTPLLKLFLQSNSRANGWALPLEIIIGYGSNRSSAEVLGWTHAAR